MRNYQHAQFEAGFKRGYSLLLQASKAYIRENGSMHPAGIASWEAAWKSDFDKYAKAKKMKDAECNAHFGIIKSYDGKVSPVHINAGNCWRLISGEIVRISPWITSPTAVWYDLNGSKGPNRLGFDVFGFVHDDKMGIVPMGMPGYWQVGNADCLEKSSARTSNGAACAFKAMKDANYFKKLPK